MSNRKMVLHESERAPRMRMQQWMMGVVLESDKRRLSRSEKLVCSKINMEQKMLCKRYRKKIQESKLTFARITQNREMEAEILEQRSLNTDIVSDMNSDELLRRVWSAGSEKFLEHRRRQEILASRKLLRMDSDSDDDEERAAKASAKRKPLSARPSTSRSMLTASSRPQTAGSRPPLSARLSVPEMIDGGEGRPTTAVSIAAPGFIRRPFTAIQKEYLPKTDKDDVVFKSADKTAQNCSDDSENETDNENEEVDKVARPVSNTKSAKHTGQRTSFAIPNTEKPATRSSIQLSTPRPNNSTRLSRSASMPAPPSRRPSNLARKASKISEGQSVCSLLHGERRPTLLDIHKDSLRSANYEDKIKRFGDQLSGMQAHESTATDYYTECLRKDSIEQNAQKRLSFEHLIDGGVPPDEYRRWSGNTRLKSITVKELDFNKPVSSSITPRMY